MPKGSDALYACECPSPSTPDPPSTADARLRIWAPPTKRRLDAIASISPDLHALLSRLICADDSTAEKLRLAHLTLPLVFDPSS